MGEQTSITCQKETKERLELHGQKGESWDELLNRIADEAGVGEIEEPIMANSKDGKLYYVKDGSLWEYDPDGDVYTVIEDDIESWEIENPALNQ